MRVLRRLKPVLDLRMAVVLTLVVPALLLLAPGVPALAGRQPKASADELAPPTLELEGGRKLVYERSFGSEREVKPKRGFWNRLVDIVAGEPDFKNLVRPYSIAVDSHGRIIVTDPGAAGVHIFDFAQQKYKFIERRDKDKDAMLGPQCVAVDAQDNIYVTDSETGKVFVFNSSGKYERVIGSLKGGEGYFKRPTGIAVDSVTQRIYVTDTLRNQIFMMDMQGNIRQEGRWQPGIQFTDRAAIGWREPDRGRRHELPGTSAGPLGNLSLLHRASRRHQWKRISAKRDWRGLGRRFVHRRWPVGSGAGI